jgi:hypothetical protein
MMLRTTLSTLLVWSLSLAYVQAQERPPGDPSSEERIVTHEEVQEAVDDRKAVLPLRIISYPHRVITRQMEKGLVTAERKHLRERLRLWQDRMRQLGIAVYFGGMGEQTGFGGGGSYTLRPADWQSVTFLARGTFARYQEFDIQWAIKPPKTEFTMEASHQWRPKENFYGLGHDSLESHHTDFALSQSWIGARVEVQAPKHVTWGMEYKFVATKAKAGTNGLIPNTPDVFPGLPGMDTLLHFHREGAYVDVDFSQGEYGWTGRGHFGAAHHEGTGSSNLRYFSYEAQGEGRMPVIEDRSALVGQIHLNLNHERGGSDEIPFYMRPHIGGSSTLRGFPLDRYYGKNLMMLSLEYRYAIHPNFQASIFHDAGQIFDRKSELAWFNWHRNYGISLRLHSNHRTIMRVEYGQSSEGFDIHLSFGDRAPQPLGGAVRYGTYRR